MKKVNFDSLTNLKAPESFIENAINATKTQKKKPLVFIKYSRALAAVACLVIMCAVSLGVYFKEDRVTPPIDPSFIVETGNSKDSENTQYTDKNIKETLKNDKDFDKENAQNSVTYNKPTTESETIEPSEKPSSTTKPTEDSKDEPTVGPTKPSESAKPSESTNTNEIPTSSPPLKPGTNPTTKPTKPSDKPKPTLPDSSSQDPNYPAAPPPEQSPDSTDGTPELPSVSPPISKPDYAAIREYKSVHDYCEIVDYIETKHLTGSKRVYCIVKKRGAGNQWLGGDDWFSPEHICTTWKEKNGYTYFAYSITNTYNITESGEYLYLIYNENGQGFYSKYIYVNANT